MTEKSTLQWIRTNLSPIIDKALKDSGNVHFTQDWIAAIVMRETGILIMRYAATKTFDEICLLMRGDYGKRAGEDAPQYHGYGFTQIDTGSFPDFINAGDWKDPYKCFLKTINVLEGKRKYLIQKLPTIQGDSLNRALTSAYNCGEGNVYKAIKNGKNSDAYTHNHDYAREVWRYRGIYNLLT